MNSNSSKTTDQPTHPPSKHPLQNSHNRAEWSWLNPDSYKETWNPTHLVWCDIIDGQRFYISEFSSRGSRNFNEDRSISNMLRFPGETTAPSVPETGLLIGGIFDGHGGSFAADFASKLLPESCVLNPDIARYVHGKVDVDVCLTALKKCFIDVHLAMWEPCRRHWKRTNHGYPSTAGTTATMFVIGGHKLIVGHIGDSVAVAGCHDADGQLHACRLTKDHQPSDSLEMDRIERSGGSVKSKNAARRVVWRRARHPASNHGMPLDYRFAHCDFCLPNCSKHYEDVPFLAVARALGDLWSYNHRTRQYVVSPEPDVSVYDMSAGRWRYIILGSDGLFNAITPTAALQEVDRKEGPTPSDPVKVYNLAELLVKKAENFYRQCCVRADNISAQVLVVEPSSQSLDMANMDGVPCQLLNWPTDGAVGFDSVNPSILADYDYADQFLVARRSFEGLNIVTPAPMLEADHSVASVFFGWRNSMIYEYQDFVSHWKDPFLPSIVSREAATCIAKYFETRNSTSATTATTATTTTTTTTNPTGSSWSSSSSSSSSSSPSSSGVDSPPPALIGGQQPMTVCRWFELYSYDNDPQRQYYAGLVHDDPLAWPKRARRDFEDCPCMYHHKGTSVLTCGNGRVELLNNAPGLQLVLDELRQQGFNVENDLPVRPSDHHNNKTNDAHDVHGNNDDHDDHDNHDDDNDDDDNDDDDNDDDDNDKEDNDAAFDDVDQAQDLETHESADTSSTDPTDPTDQTDQINLTPHKVRRRTGTSCTDDDHDDDSMVQLAGQHQLDHPSSDSCFRLVTF